MYTTDLIFSHPRIEAKFRRAVSVKEEVGGWLLTTGWTPSLWPGKFSRTQIAKSLGIATTSCLDFIEGFVIAPNESKNPEHEWSPWHYERARQVADATARAMGCRLMHFHTHPNGTRKLSSPGDVAFAASCCQLMPGLAELCVVTSHPLRIWPYRVSWGNAAQPEKDSEHRCGRFWSWRTRGLRNLR